MTAQDQRDHANAQAFDPPRIGALTGFAVVYNDRDGDHRRDFDTDGEARDFATLRWRDLTASKDTLVFNLATGQVRTATAAWQLPWRAPRYTEIVRLDDAPLDGEGS